MHKIGVAAYEQSNVLGERFSADDSIIIPLLQVAHSPIFSPSISVNFPSSLSTSLLYFHSNAFLNWGDCIPSILLLASLRAFMMECNSSSRCDMLPSSRVTVEGWLDGSIRVIITLPPSRAKSDQPRRTPALRCGTSISRNWHLSWPQAYC